MRTFTCWLLLCFPFTAAAQNWFAELSVGGASYNGDITQKAVALNRVRPTVGINIKYNTNYLLNFRGGISYARLTADDRNNKDTGLQSRNLSFATDLFELHGAVEVNLMDPELFYSYPYVFAGVGLFYFNPYAFDKEGTKTFLRPLSTEGQGLPEYPGKKKYSQIQLCIPMGAGWKYRLKSGMELSYEIGYRLLFTDYLDDVSTDYPDLDVLRQRMGEKAAEMSYRRPYPFKENGEHRGNSKIKDSYLYSTLKLAINLDRFSKVKNYRRNDF